MNAIDDLFHLVLVDGIPVQADGKSLRYREVRLRETNVADERAAQRLAERVVPVGGVPKLLVSDADFRYALTMRHIESLACDGMVIQGALIDLDLFGKLTSHDLGLIEQRVFLITMAAELRYGNLTQAEFDAILAGDAPKQAGSPQPSGQAPRMGPADAGPESGPALLADFTGAAPRAQAEGDAP